MVSFESIVEGFKKGKIARDVFKNNLTNCRMKIFYHFVVSFDNDQSCLHLCEADIDKQFRSRDVAAVVRCEKHYGLGELMGVPNLPSGTLSEIIFLRCWPVSEEASRLLSPGVSDDLRNVKLSDTWRPKNVFSVKPSLNPIQSCRRRLFVDCRATGSITNTGISRPALAR